MKVKRIIIILMLFILFVTLFSQFNTLFAKYTYSQYTGDLGAAANASKDVQGIMKTVLTAIRYAGSGISLIMLTVIFIKYMLSAASERAEIKKNLIPFVIGAVVLFAASNLTVILQKTASKMFP